MTPESMETYLRSRLKVELLKLDRLRATAIFPLDLQLSPADRSAPHFLAHSRANLSKSLRE